METVTVVEFARGVGMYRSGERAGFAPDVAEKMVAQGMAKVVHRDAPRVSAAALLSDARSRLDGLKQIIAVAEKDAKKSLKTDPAGAEEALAVAQSTRAAVVALERQLTDAGLLGPAERLPNASQAA
jgi:hypothetical protein